MQDVFLRVIRGLDSLRSTDRPEGWLFQIARNALRDSLRARLRRDGRTDTLEIDLPAEPDAAAERAAEAELAPCLTAMVGRLPEPYRTAITLDVAAGRDPSRRGAPGGPLDSGMKSRVQRGREQLRQMLVTCCAIAVDVQGGVSDFYLREPGACAGPSPATSEPCGQAPCGPDPTRDASPASGRRLQE